MTLLLVAKVSALPDESSSAFYGIDENSHRVVRLRSGTISMLPSIEFLPPLHRKDFRWSETAKVLEREARVQESLASATTAQTPRGRVTLEAAETDAETLASSSLGHLSGNATTTTVRNGKGCYETLDLNSELSRWWREGGKARQVIVSFDYRHSNGSSVEILQQALGRYGDVVDFLAGERYLVIVSDAFLPEFREKMDGLALVADYESQHKLPPEMLALLQVLRITSVSTSSQTKGPRKESFDLTPNMSLQIVSKGGEELDAPAQNTSQSSEGMGMMLPVKALDIQLKGSGNQTLDFFSVAVDQHDRFLVSATTPGSRHLRVDAMRSALQRVVASCCGTEEGSHGASPAEVCKVQKAQDEFESAYEHSTAAVRKHLSFKVAVPRSKFGDVVGSLSKLPFVNWIEPELEVRVFNHIASEVLQVGSRLSDRQASSTSYTGGQQKHPFWDMGLDGQGQIVGVGDTGLDVKSCFFWDPDHDVGYEHKKVIGYRGFADYEDTSGHGTHVCGSIAGKAIGENARSYSDYNGMAPEAKLAFTDLGLSYGDQRGLIAPETMEEYYEYGYGLGARLHSDSWGGLSTAYTRSAREVDEYHFYHPEFLGMIAAGNDGEFLSSNDVESTVSTPATCKNALAVGATLSYGYMDPPIDPITNFEVVEPRAFSKRQFQVVSALFTPVFEFEEEEVVQVVMTDFPQLCESLSESDAEKVKGKVVLVERGVCFFSDKIRKLAEAGAKGAIVYNNEESGHGFYKMAASEPGIFISIPSASVPLSTGRMLTDAIKSSNNSAASIKFMSRTVKSLPAYESVAEFSSFGPTIDGRVKPDVVAPGEDIKSSSKSYFDNQCTTERISGTSMATPLVAGITAIVRQYLMGGYYPLGNNGTSDAVTPTGALIKGIIINGAAQLKGFAQSGLPLEPPPSFRQGWGRVELDTSLPLPSSGKELRFADWKNLQSTGDSHHYCLKTPKGANLSSISITLNWMDAPGALSGGGYLVNDLDLDISVPLGAPEVSWGAALHPDRVNNVEKAIVQYPQESSLYQITVKAHQIKWPMGNGRGQLYALVVFGPQGIELSESCEEMKSAMEAEQIVRGGVPDQKEEDNLDQMAASVAGEGL